MELAKIKRIILGPKEGLALNNGATFSAAMSALAVADAEYLLHVAEISAALSMEGLCACSAAFDERIHQLRLHNGQMTTAKNIRSLLEGSNLIDSSGKVQDAYSLRCAPQVQGAVRDSINYVRK
jgi:histidine ammonia-lyase